MKRYAVPILFIAIFLLGAWFRFYQITETPPGLYPDEAANGNNAVEAIRTGAFKVFYPENNGREGFFINIQALSLALFGFKPLALRIVSAAVGTLTVLGIYVLASELWRNGSEPSPEAERRRKRIALLAMFFLATSYWHTNFSRIGFRAIMVPLVMTWAWYWLLKAIRTGKVSSAVAGGITFGIGFHTYIAFRFAPFAVAIPMAIALVWWYRGRIREYCIPCLLAIYIFAAFVVAIPIGLYFLGNPADFFGRSSEVSIFSAASPLTELAKSTLLTLGMFNIAGDCNLRHNLVCQPELFWPVGIFFLIGIALAIGKLWKGTAEERLGSATVLGWFFFLMFPATLTRESLPHALRSIGLIVPAILFAAAGAGDLWGGLVRYFNRAAENPKFHERVRQIGRIKKELAVAAILVLVWIPLRTYRDYFVWFAYADKTRDVFAADLVDEASYLNALPQDVEKFVIVNLSGGDIRGLPAPAQTILFLTDTADATRQAAAHMHYVTNPDQLSMTGSDPTVIVPMNPRDRTLIENIKTKFPSFTLRVPSDFVVLEKNVPH